MARLLAVLTVLVCVSIALVSAGPCNHLPVNIPGGKLQYFNLDPLTNLQSIGASVAYGQPAATFNFQFRVCADLQSPCPNTLNINNSACALPSSSGSCMSWTDDRQGQQSVCKGQFRENGPFAFHTSAIANGIQLTYYGGDNCTDCPPPPVPFRSVLKIYCDKSKSGNPAVSIQGFDPAATSITYVIHHAAGCPIPPKKHLSAGSVMLIIFFVFLAVYLIVGAALNRFLHQESGMGLIPNLAFWQSLPGLMSDGVRFIMCRPPVGAAGAYEVVN